jgi:hypothetical protein
MNNKIYLNDWLSLKPYDKQTFTDIFYLKLANEVKQAIVNLKYPVSVQKYLDNERFNHFACFLTSYFEDIISETNIWNTFTRLHKRLYKKVLPFYDIDEYFENEINVVDVKFLIWYYFNTIQDQKLIAPYNDFIEVTTLNVMDVFEKAWDYAPENKHLLTFYQIDKNESDYYVARNLIDTLLFKTYLFNPDTCFKFKKSENEIVKQNKNQKYLALYLSENRDVSVYSSYTQLLGLSGKEWVSELIGSKHPLSSDFLNISPRIAGYFLYKGQDSKYVFLEHIASSKSFSLTKKSFEYTKDLYINDTILYLGMVQWKNEWWFSGIHFQMDFDADLVLNEKNSFQSRASVSALDYQQESVKEVLEKQFQAFKDFNNGSLIAFTHPDNVKDFFNSYTTFYNNSLNLTEKQKKESRERIRKDGYFDGNTNSDLVISKDFNTAVLFFNPKSGCEVAYNVNSAFPLPTNPYFEPELSEQHILTLLMDESISTELAMFCIDNYQSELPFFTNGIGKTYLKDMDFLLRFWKKKNYYSKPAITMVGKA